MDVPEQAWPALGAGREVLSDEEMAAYHARVAQLAPPDMLSWLHAPGVL